MKTVFEGKVNGEVFNNVADYNTALTNALKGGAEVHASSKTYTVEDEPQPAKPKFRGVVNGKEFSDVESYNKAVMEVLESGQPLNATSETSYCEGNWEEDQCCCDECEEADLYIGMNEDNYYMDVMTGEKSDQETYDRCKELLEENLKQVLEEVEGWKQAAIQNYLKELDGVINTIASDSVTNEKLIETTVLEKQALEEKLAELNLKSDMLYNCGKINKLFGDYYKKLHELLNDKTTVYASESQPESNEKAALNEDIALNEDAALNGAQRLLKAIFEF